MTTRGYPSVKVLCLDEIAPHKRHGGYWLIISAPELGLVLDVLKDRKKANLEAWFEQRGLAWCASVEVCCADVWAAYHEAARAHLPRARLTVDRFHVMKNLTDAVTKARRTIQKNADEATQQILKGGRWLLVKNSDDLTDEERPRLATMLAASPDLKQGYELKEAFRHWFNQPLDRATAADQWWYNASCVKRWEPGILLVTTTERGYHDDSRVRAYCAARHQSSRFSSVTA